MQTNAHEIAAVQAAAIHRSVPLSRLRLSAEYQARKQPAGKKLTVEQLAATIAVIGVLQNLVVVEEKDGWFGVCAGGRRLAALQYLLEQGTVTGSYDVPVLVIPAEHAHHASLIENNAREDMHPADLVAAYARLHADGMTQEAIATAHGASLLSVRKLLALADIAPPLMELFRADKLDLPTMQALAATSDHERQIEAFNAAKNSYSRANTIRSILANGEVPATSALARYLTVATYEKAGGKVRRDLFTEGNHGVFLEDPALVRTLVLEKLQRSKAAKALASEGWGWVECMVSFEHEERRMYGELGFTRREPTKEEAAELKKLQQQLGQAQKALAALQDEGDYSEDDEDGLFEKIDDLEQKIERVESTLVGYDPAHKRVAGCVVTVGDDGAPRVHAGLIRRDDRDAAAELKRQSGSAAGDGDVSLPPAQTRPVHSQALVDRLNAQRVCAIQAELMERRNLALCLLITQLLEQVSTHIDYGHRFPKLFSLHAQASAFDLKNVDGDIEQSRAWQALDAKQAMLISTLPTDFDGLLAHLLGLPQDSLVQILALLTSMTVYRTLRHDGRTEHIAKLAQLMGVDMANWWVPTAASYLGAVSKARIVEVVTEARGAEQAQPLATMKKGEAAKAAEALLAGSRWLPESMRTVETSAAEAAPAGDDDTESELDPHA